MWLNHLRYFNENALYYMIKTIAFKVQQIIIALLLICAKYKNLCEVYKDMEISAFHLLTVFTNLHTACFLHFVEYFVFFYDLLIHSTCSTSIFKDGWSELTPRVLYKRTTNRKQVKKIETSIIEFLIYIGYLVSFRFYHDI